MSRAAAAVAVALALAAVAACVVGGVAACARPAEEPAPPPHPSEPHLAAMEQAERARRAEIDWAAGAPGDTALGPDPVAVVALVDAGEARYAGLLRGASALVLVDGGGRELARAATVRAPRSLTREGSLLVVTGPLGERAGFAFASGRLLPARAPAEVVKGDGWRVRVDVIGHAVVVEHAGKSRTLHADGPIWSAAVRPLASGGALVALGMIEDHALDRTGGSFGFIDSALRVVELDAGLQTEGRILDLNASQHAIVTPRALAFVDDDTVLVAGAASGRAAKVRVRSGVVEPVPSLPGVVSLVPTADGFFGASALLDAWVIVDAAGARAVPVVAAPSSRTAESKLGEALAFTTIMAPRQQSEGPLSRFSCEACHFEGGIDGRVHHTGRTTPTGEGVRATTRPLWGLFNNVPLFSRAMDPNITRMVHAEFNVANANSPLDAWFALTPADAPWLALLGVQGTQGPAELRRGLVAFLADFTPPANPHVIGKAAFTDMEARGAAVFRERCAACHAARLVGDDPASELPFHRWEPLVLQENGPIVWSSPERRKTGIAPLVHDEGARSSSLRRVWAKRPYFTNGSSPDLADVVRRVRVGADVTAFRHVDSEGGAPLSADEQHALVAFLELL